jgi:hypothetical protein
MAGNDRRRRPSARARTGGASTSASTDQGRAPSECRAGVAGDFIPVRAGWEDRSLFVATEGRLSFYHYDPCSQALAKLERAHARDLADVQAMIDGGLVEPRRILECYEAIEPELYRFPAIDPPSFGARVREALDTAPARQSLTDEETT